MTEVDIFQIGSRDTWLAMRRGFTGASEVAALVDAHPWMTVGELWARKSGRLDPEPENKAMKRGKYLEETALRLLEDERPDWHVRPNPVPPGNFFTDPQNRLCATPDAFVSRPPDILDYGICQIKSVSPRSFKREWVSAGTGEIEAPLHVTIQTTMEMHLTGCTWGVICALVVDDGIDLTIIDVKPIPGLVETLVEKNREFWQMVETGVRPPLDYGRDLKLITKLNPTQSDKTIDLSGDNEFIEACNEHDACSHDISLLSKRKAYAEATIRHKLGDASGAEAGEFFVSSRIVHRAAHQVAASVSRQIRIRHRGMRP